MGRTTLSGRLREEVCRAARHRLPLALLMFHVEAPPESSEARGALTRAAVTFTRAVVRKSDVVESLGAGRFGVVANAPCEGANALGESLVRLLSAFEFCGADGPLTLQVRYAHSSLGGTKTAEDLLREARAGLEADGRAIG